MPRPGRLLLLLLLVTAVVVAGVQLRNQQVPFADVAITGIGFVAALLAFFALLLGFGKLIGRLASRRNQ